MEKKASFSTFIKRTEQSVVVRSIRSGLVNMIPVLIIGAFALIITTLPIEGYQTFISEFAGGFINNVFTFINKATFGVLSVFMTFSISRSYMKIKADDKAVNGGATVAALIAFFILAGSYLEISIASITEEAGELTYKFAGFSLDSTGPKSMFLAIGTGLGASALYLVFERLFRKHKVAIFTVGADKEFNRMLSTFFPILCTVLVFAVGNQIVISIFKVDSFRSLLIEAFNALFKQIPDGFFKGFLFVFLSSFMWFFGIHGSDTLESVMETHFVPNLADNIKAISDSFVADHVLTKEFFDCFVLMGGCGTTICLLIAILIFSRNRAHRGLGYTATIPMLFNINELMVFGLPIVLNPIMFIPFMTVPLVCYSVSYLAISAGIVPYITSNVEWTTPIILGGYTATGSIAGSLLQLFNVAIGVMIYFPFIKFLDRRSAEDQKNDYSSFITYCLENETAMTTTKLTALKNKYGNVARGLCADIKHSLKSKINLAYQPQYNYEGDCIGVETLLRFNHQLHGVVYPPLVIKLAEEGGFLADLEEAVMVSALSDRAAISARFGEDVKMSVNVTGTTVVTQRFLQFCRKINEDTPFKDAKLCIEITEQAALNLGDEAISILKAIRELGATLSIDDFSMGKTSIQYLKDNLFDELKLDGSLVGGLFTHQNCREIVQSITKLSDSLNITVIAEYVETEEQRDVLHDIGCNCYQGYLYSPAVFLDKK